MQKIKSLDGLRGLSIILVILGHTYHSFTAGEAEQLFKKFYFYHNTGVSIFFVLSGYLISKILLIEENKSGTISLKNFYLKRFFRIFPAYYFYILVFFVVSATGIFAIENKSFIGAILYTGWYYPQENLLQVFGHFWSLSVEEHFYLIYPFLFFIVKKQRIPLLTALTLAAPLIRVLNYFLLPAYKAKMGYLTHTRYDMLLFGCLMALNQDKTWWKNLVEKFRRRYFEWIPPLVIFVINPLLKIYLGARYKFLVGYTVDGFFICLYISLVMLKERTFYENGLLCRIGIYSYSLYLWQQPFTHYFPLPWNLLATAAAALISYYLIEKPFLRLKARLTY